MSKFCLAILFAVFLNVLQQTQAAPPAKANPDGNPVPEWIWAEKERERQNIGARTTFELPADATAIDTANLWYTADNDATVFINGKKISNNPIWQVPVSIEVAQHLRAGKNVLAIYAKNDNAGAGLIAKLQIVLRGDSKIEIVTNGDWRVMEQPEKGWIQPKYDDAKWAKAKVIGKYGIGPWDKLPRPGFAGLSGQATPAEMITVLPGFKIERLYSVPKEKEDSWVSMTTDPKGRLIVSGQAGPMFRVTVGAKPEDTKVEKIEVPLGGAQGLLWAYDALYVTVNGPGLSGNGSGVYRVTDTDNNDQLDKVERLIDLPGAQGEHGPHATRLGPDGKIYLVAGNFTALPTDILPNSPAKNWAEDQLLPRNPDGGGHDPHIMAPAGWIIRFDKDGKNRELMLNGLRNTYDIAFNPDGELFTYDSDMEWDMGTPWYRPTRVNLAVSGGEYGWRNGTGKWPEYSPDSIGAVVNTGMGSPVGIDFGTKAKFPAKYQHALFLGDWSYGKIYAAHITPDGAGYRGTFEKFVDGKPFGVTDLLIHPTDGNMYITIGGRGTQSGLYRVSYVGSESTEPAKPQVDEHAAAQRAIRHKLESFHGKQDPAAVDFAWQYLGSSDRYLRFAARIAIEWQDMKSWKQKALDERDPTASIQALVALVRTGSINDGLNPDKTVKFKPNPELQREVLDAFSKLPAGNLSEEQSLEALRALGLSFSRLGQPDEGCRTGAIAALEPAYPSQSWLVNREISQILAYLQSPTVVAKTMALLKSASTQEEQLHYALILRGVKVGWTPEQRQAYFSLINIAQQKYTGGNSFKNFLVRIKDDAIATLTEQEKKDLAPFLQGKQEVEVVQATTPRQFIRNWQMADLTPVIDKATHDRNFEKGKLAYQAAQCAKCHRFAGDGASTGPDLTGAGNRFAPADVLEAIVLPSKIISDQYRPMEFITKSRTLVSGQVEAEDAETLTIRANPLAPDVVKLKKADIAQKRPAKMSLMPEGLLDTFSEDEILDMIAYVRSGGSKDDKAFAKK